MIDIKGFSGILDSDNPPSGVPNGYHMMAYNGRFKGVNGLLRFQNIEGNRQINYTLPAGDNECIGNFYSPVDNKIYWFIWNENSDHCIFVADMSTETVTKIIQSTLNTDGDILNFDLDAPITSAAILYGSEGNVLYYVDSLGRPTEIDVELFINTPYTTTKREYIDLAKAPAIMPPKVSYENDYEATANNFRDSLHQFAYRPIYINNEKSVYSSGSGVPLPYQPFNQDISKDVTKNSRIAIYVSTFDVNVSGIEIIGRKMQNGIVSDWYKIVALDKDELSIDDNSVYRYLFYNDSAYPTVPTEGSDPTTQVLNLQDYVPQQTNTLALLNGNVLGFGGITEGYDKIEPNITITTLVSDDIRANNINGILFFASQNGLASIGIGNTFIIYLTGTGDNDPTTNEPLTLYNSVNTTYVVSAQTTAEVDKSFSYTENGSNANIADILDGISAAAQLQGFTEVSLSDNTLVLSQANVVLLSSMVTTTDSANTFESVYANAPRATYSYGLQYFDSKGRTNGVVYGTSVDTAQDTLTDDQLILNIFHEPPLWATYYHVVRTRNTTYSKLLNWVSESSFSNKSAVSGDTFSYIGISSIKEYNIALSSTSGVVSYEFNKGDRIRFISRYMFDGTSDDTGMEDLDYEILGTVENPIVDGEVKTGTFIKIYYPATDIGANFQLDGSDEFQNYHIWLYGVADKLDKTLEFFYEFGQQYGIGNAGTANAYHAGQLNSQSIDLSVPARILLDKGDWFSRYRNVISAVTYNAQAGGNRFGNRYSTARIIFPEDVTNASFEIRSNTAAPAGTSVLDYPTFSDTDYLFYNLLPQGVNIRIRATIDIYADHDTAVDVYLKQAGIITAPGEQLTTIIEGVSFAGGTTKQIIIDGIYYVSAGCKVWLLIGNTEEVIDVQVRLYNLALGVLKYTNIPIIEQSFSDLSYIDLNANSRVTVIDENAARIYFPTRFRWGLGYLRDTNINNINRLYAANYTDWDRGKGDIRRLVVRDGNMRVFQSKGIGRVGIYTRFVQDNLGSQILTTTDDIITKNNINYYQGEYGIGDYPTSLVSTDSFDSIIDVVRGYQIIIDNAGIRLINELYLGQYYISGLLAAYNKEWTKPNGSRAKIYQVYNYVDEEIYCILEGGENGEDEIESYCFTFNMKRNGYSNFINFIPENTASIEEKIVGWRNGELWVNDNTTDYCNFFGVQYDCNITIPFNKPQMEKKGWRGVVEQSNVIWVCPEIYTQVMSYGDVPQESNLINGDFRLKEGMFHASFLRDLNSVKGISNGDKLKGTYMVIKFQPLDSSNFVFLTSLSVKFVDSPLIPA